MKRIFFLLMIVTMIASCKNEKSTIKPAPKLSLAEWSLHKTLQGNKMTNLEFAGKAKELGFQGIEYVNQFFKDKAQDTTYLDSLNAAAQAAGVQQLLIMIDGEGYLGDADSLKRDTAVNNHKQWVLAAKYLGCHSIRVNAHGEGTAQEVSDNVVKGLRALCDFAAPHNINVIVENHGGYSSNGSWLADVIQRVNKVNCGTLPDFGNFCLKREGGVMYGAKCIEEYDMYVGISEMMPYAKGVSAKSYDFDANGNDTKIDYAKMLKIVKEAKFDGFIGVEYEGEKLGEIEGIKATKALILKNW